MAKLLVVEDNFDLLSNLQEWLSLQNHEVEVCSNGSDALQLLAHSPFELIVMDVGIPDIDGFAVCRRYRASGGHTPIIFLSGRNSVASRVEGLDYGGDDYLAKPFDFRELSARIKALIRRSVSVETGLLGYLDLKLDLRTKQVRRSGKPLYLANNEFKLLEFFLRHPNEVYSAKAILMHVWSSESEATEQSVRASIKRLRQVIDRDSSQSYILNLHGHGYGLNKDLSLAKDVLGADYISS